MSADASLFACTRCHSRHPFEQLSQPEQLCKECRSNFPVVKCTYCRAKFQQEDKNTNAICKKCTHNVKTYGKPSACEYCNIIAAFIGNKCQRCTNSDKKWGPPKTCEQCKQMCAYKRDNDSERQDDGKLLCWLCTMTYKKVLAKTKKQDDIEIRRSSTSSRHSSSTSSQQKKDRHHSSSNRSKHENQSSLCISNKHKKDQNRNKEQKDQTSKQQTHKSKTHHGDKKSHSHNHTPSKRTKMENTSNGVTSTPSKSDQTTVDPASTEHIIQITQLREEVEALKKQLQVKDQQLLEKEKKLTELKAQNYETEKELRSKIQSMSKQHTDAIETLQSKNRLLTKQIAVLSKPSKKIGSNSPSIVF